jgi:hypothetical protein
MPKCGCNLQLDNFATLSAVGNSIEVTLQLNNKKLPLASGKRFGK